MMWSSRVPAPIARRFWRTGWWWKRERRRRCSIGRAMRRRAHSSQRLHRRRLDPKSSFPFPPRALPRAGHVLVLELVLIQVVVEVLVEALVLFEFLEILFVETVAATLERPVRRVTGQHCHPLLVLSVERALPLRFESRPGAPGELAAFRRPQRALAQPDRRRRHLD